VDTPARPRLRLGIVAGEPSGDELAARVLAALRTRCEELVVEGVGGPLMAAQGLRSWYPMERLSVMGLIEPLQRLPELLRMRRHLLRRFLDDPPDVFLGVDAPDFNLSLERRLRRAGVRTAHLVSPSVWAWRRGRIHRIRQSTDVMLCLFPFEPDVYRRHGVAAHFVGHPLADDIALQTEPAAARARLGLSPTGKVVALLPGSRRGEVAAMANLFLQVAQRLWQGNPQLSFVLPAANPPREQELRRHLLAFPQLPVTLVPATAFPGHSREAMAAADIVLAAAGTATLEAALLKRPVVVAYRTGALSWWLLSRLVRTEFVALPNLIAGKSLVPELLQGAATVDTLVAELSTLLSNGPMGPAVIGEFDNLHRQLRRGSAARVADALLGLAAQREVR
jgi:lipid-A-disaccharide synthase